MRRSRHPPIPIHAGVACRPDVLRNARLVVHRQSRHASLYLPCDDAAGGIEVIDDIPAPPSVAPHR